MPAAHQSDEELTPEMLNPPIGWEEIEEEKRRDEALRYSLSLTPSQRLDRLQKAMAVAERLDRIAARHGLRSLGWSICGPVERQGK
jgi:hypothetical protein